MLTMPEREIKHSGFLTLFISAYTRVYERKFRSRDISPVGKIVAGQARRRAGALYVKVPA